MFIFIQEHWLSSYKAKTRFSIDFSSYDFLTTSCDTFLPPEDILLKSGPTCNGTAIGWHSSFSSSINQLPTISTRFCDVKFNNNNLEIIAYTVYLPTAGQDDDFTEEISFLTNDLLLHSSSSSIFIIGIDANCSEKSSLRRQEVFASFTEKFSLKTLLPGKEPTFHHNNGLSETQTDHINVEIDYSKTY